MDQRRASRDHKHLALLQCFSGLVELIGSAEAISYFVAAPLRALIASSSWPVRRNASTALRGPGLRAGRQDVRYPSQLAQGYLIFINKDILGGYGLRVPLLIFVVLGRYLIRSLLVIRTGPW